MTKFKKLYRDFKLKLDSPERMQMISLGNSKEFLNALRTYSWKLVSLCMGSKSKTLNRTRFFYNFGKYLLVMNKRHGSTYVVKYLKASQLAVQKVIAGQPFKSLREIEPDLPLPRLSRSGLPVIIGTRDRRAILSGSKSVIRMILTLFGVYRIISAEPKSKLNSITDLFSGNTEFLKMASSWFLSNGKAKLGSIQLSDLKVTKFGFRETASPSNVLSWKGLLTDIFALSLNIKVNNAFLQYLKVTGSRSLMDYFLETQSSIIYNGVEGLPLKKSVNELTDQLVSESKIPIGQLSFKKEAAGKLRIFALVDSWTQSILDPLHQSMFGILKGLPNDGTFDQDASFKRCQEKSALYGVAYGYDLSSATDRLPMDLQVNLLASLSSSWLLATS
jgi:hypothetical protein